MTKQRNGWDDQLLSIYEEEQNFGQLLISLPGRFILTNHHFMAF
jgi:hypothetical protein